MTDDLENLKQQLQDALAEIEKLRKENARLKQTAVSPVSTSAIKHKVKVHQPVSTSSKIHSQSAAEEKIALFRQLFRGREDVYPLQKAPREKGTSVFLDGDFQPFPDQWAYLFSIDKLTPKKIEDLVSQAANISGYH